MRSNVHDMHSLQANKCDKGGKYMHEGEELRMEVDVGV